MSSDVSESNPSPSSGRPVYHFVAPRGWLNDPCAPGYDPRTGLFHSFYQWNPHSHAWDKISWGHATSKDLSHWDHASDDTPILVPDAAYDLEGVFTGCFYPTGPAGEPDQLTVFYSSVNHLPIAWDQPYSRGCEGSAMATSGDGGKTWRKYAHNPILAEEPPAIHVTGFRDPYLAPWPEMDGLRGQGSSLYGLISGGIHDQGPRTFLYSVDPTDLTQWTYLHPLVVDIPNNFVPSDKWSGDLGVNWECTNFVTLSHGRHTRTVLIPGSEGGHERPWVARHYEAHPASARRVPRYGNWFFGNSRKHDDKVQSHIGPAGSIDWGILYAENTFQAPDGRRLLWGWIIEEDSPNAVSANKGWTGCMGLPRELFLQVTEKVVGAISSSLDSVGSFDLVHDKTDSVVTLGIRPAQEIGHLRRSLSYDHSPSPIKPTRLCLVASPSSCEIAACIHVFESTKSISIVIRHSSDCSIQTRIVFDCKRETLSVLRNDSTNRSDVNTSPEIGSHTLLRSADTTDTGCIEPSRLRVFIDHDVIEVFANDRFAIATRVYTPEEHTGITLASEGGGWVEESKIWETGNTRRAQARQPSPEAPLC